MCIIVPTIIVDASISMSEETVARWRAEEEAARARLAATAGYARSDQIRGRTGMEIFQGIFAGDLPRPPIGDTLDFVPIRIEPGLAVFQGRPQLKRAEGKLIHAGRQVATAEGRLVGPDGKLYAHATTTCLIFDREKVRRLEPSAPPPPPSL